MKNLERFFKYDRQGHRFVITEVYDSPYEKDDKRVNGNNRVYATYIESILLNYFKQHNGYKFSFTKRQLWETLGIVNKNYFNYSYKMEDLLTMLHKYDSRLQPWLIERFYSRSKQKLNDIVKSALNSLKKRNLIQYKDDILMACQVRNHFEITEPQKISKVLEIKRETIDELVGATKKVIKDGKEIIVPTDVRDIIFNRDKNINYEIFLNLRNKKLKDSLGFDFVYRKYSIICNREYLVKDLAKNEQMLKKSLNSKVILKVNELAQKDFNRNKEDIKSGKKTFRYPGYYVNTQKLLSEKLLDINITAVEELSNDLVKIGMTFDELIS